MEGDTEALRHEIASSIATFANSYKLEVGDSAVNWLEPLVGFADAQSPAIRALKTVVSPTHFMPEDILDGAQTVISYFIPFDPRIGKGNVKGDEPSRVWVRAYNETNDMFVQLNLRLVTWLSSQGARAAVPENIGTIDGEHIYSNWSQRHIAYAAGLGTFGINNMLITERGTCGRFSSLVTDIRIVPDAPLEEERCLYKRNGSCGACVNRCPIGALSLDGRFDREKCYDRLAVFERNLGADVCGKCTVGLPCTFGHTKQKK